MLSFGGSHWSQCMCPLQLRAIRSFRKAWHRQLITAPELPASAQTCILVKAPATQQRIRLRASHRITQVQQSGRIQAKISSQQRGTVLHLMTSHSDKGALPDPAPLSIKIEEDTAQPTHTNPGGNGMPLTGPRLPSQADPQEDKSTLQLVLHLQHQDQQPGSDEKALQIVHGPLPEGLQQV